MGKTDLIVRALNNKSTHSSATVVADTVSERGARITTMLLQFPLIIQAEILRHRVFSFTSTSSRAVPVAKVIEQVENWPYIPDYWGANQPGMQADAEISEADAKDATLVWLEQRDAAVKAAKYLATKLSVHKQTANRLLEPFMYRRLLVTGTDWENFFNLRVHQAAHPDMQTIAALTLAAYLDSTPRYCDVHLPFATADELDVYQYDGEIPALTGMLCAARCARLSTETHDGTRDPDKDLSLANRLIDGGHMSPFEHVAEACGRKKRHANLRGWRSLRSRLKRERDRLGAKFPGSVL